MFHNLDVFKITNFCFFPRKFLFRSKFNYFSVYRKNFQTFSYISAFPQKSLSDAFMKLNVSRLRITHLMIGRPFCYFVSMFLKSYICCQIRPTIAIMSHISYSSRMSYQFCHHTAIYIQ